MESKKYRGEVVIKEFRRGFSWGLVGSAGRLTLRCEAVGDDGPDGAQFTTAAEAQDFARGHGLTVVERFIAAPAEPAPMLVQLVRLPNTRHSGSRRNWAFARSDMYVTNTLELTPFAKLAACFEWRGQAEEWAREKGLAVEDGFIDQSRAMRGPAPAAKPTPKPPALAAYRCKDGTLAPRLTPAQAERLALLLGADGVES